jgi:hypothetical protein
MWGCDSSVNIETGYVLDGRVLIPGRGKKVFSSPQWPAWLWGVKLTIHLYCQSQNCEAIISLPHTSSWRGPLLIKNRDNFYPVLTLLHTVLLSLPCCDRTNSSKQETVKLSLYLNKHCAMDVYGGMEVWLRDS